MLVFDLTNHKSFKNLQNWIEESQKYTQDNVALILVGNKCDLES